MRSSLAGICTHVLLVFFADFLVTICEMQLAYKKEKTRKLLKSSLFERKCLSHEVGS